MISIIPVTNIPIITDATHLWQVLLDGISEIVEDGDVLVCAHTPFSRVMGYQFYVDDVVPGEQAIKLGAELDKDPRKIQIILDASSQVVKHGRNIIITENHAGIVCANAGVDESNAGRGYVVTVPDDPDALAREIRQRIMDNLGKDVIVIISDTVGRALRRAAVNIGVGVAGMSAMRSDVGKPDLFGYEMKISIIAIIDELASAAELVQGQSNEGTPFVIIRGYKIDFVGEESAKILNRPEEERLFR